VPAEAGHREGADPAIVMSRHTVPMHRRDGWCADGKHRHRRRHGQRAEFVTQGLHNTFTIAQFVPSISGGGERPRPPTPNARVTASRVFSPGARKYPCSRCLVSEASERLFFGVVNLTNQRQDETKLARESGRCDGSPHSERAGSQHSMLPRSQVVATHAKQILHDTVNGQEALGVVG
jgi:hypothetical protein